MGDKLAGPERQTMGDEGQTMGDKLAGPERLRAAPRASYYLLSLQEVP